eukprot:468416-Rhodomonas_salina.1
MDHGAPKRPTKHQQALAAAQEYRKLTDAGVPPHMIKQEQEAAAMRQSLPTPDMSFSNSHGGLTQSVTFHDTGTTPRIGSHVCNAACPGLTHGLSLPVEAVPHDAPIPANQHPQQQQQLHAQIQPQPQSKRPRSSDPSHMTRGGERYPIHAPRSTWFEFLLPATECAVPAPDTAPGLRRDSAAEPAQRGHVPDALETVGARDGTERETSAGQPVSSEQRCHSWAEPDSDDAPLQILSTKHRHLKISFRRFDEDHKGTIDLAELYRVAVEESGIQCTRKELEELWDLFDRDRDGIIKYADYAK